MQAAAWSTSTVPGGSRPRSTSVPNGTARLLALAGLERDVLGRQRLDLGDALARDGGVVGVALDADEVAAEPLRDRAGRAGAEERVEHDVARLGRTRAGTR